MGHYIRFDEKDYPLEALGGLELQNPRTFKYPGTLIYEETEHPVEIIAVPAGLDITDGEPLSDAVDYTIDLEEGVITLLNKDYEGWRLLFSGYCAKAPSYRLLKRSVFIYILPEDDTSVGDKIRHTFSRDDVAKDNGLIIAEIRVAPNLSIDDHEMIDTRSRGGGIKDDVTPRGREIFFWDIL